MAFPLIQACVVIVFRRKTDEFGVVQYPTGLLSPGEREEINGFHFGMQALDRVCFCPRPQVFSE
jgi:hypothetical protein